MNYDYFYGSQADSYSFYRIPRLLITGEDFKSLSTDAKLLYGLMLDRMGLSARNGWLDDAGRVYIYYTIDEITEDLNCGHGKAVKLLAELDTSKGIGLIERVKQGQGKPTRIYVKQFTASSRPPKNGSLEVQKAENQTSEKRNSGLPKTGNADFSKTDTNYIENNYTYQSYTDPSIYPAIDGEDYTEEVKEQIDYELLCINYPTEDISAYVELICEVYSKDGAMTLGGETVPASKVKRRFEKLEYDHIAYVIDSLRESNKRIKNMKAYLLTALYNAPLTIGSFYAAAVRQDN
jgi:hypothetical protein